MTYRNITRRIFALGISTSAAAFACGGSDDPDASTTGSGGEGGDGAAGGTTSSGGGQPGSGGMEAAGGNNPSSSSSSSAGGTTMSSCGTALVVRGSNWDVDPHEMVIPIEDILAGQTMTYPTTGESHTHDVTVTAEQFEALKNGQTVRIYVCFASPSFIDHEFPISCADPAIAPLMEGELGDENNCPT